MTGACDHRAHGDRAAWAACRASSAASRCLRRRALVGDLLSHAALPGICLAFLVAGGKELLATARRRVLSGLVGVALVTLISRWTRTKEDAAIGIVLSTFFGLGIVLSSLIQRSRRRRHGGA